MGTIASYAASILLVATCVGKSPSETVTAYYSKARSGDVSGAKRLLASYEWIKARRFPKNMDIGIAAIRKRGLEPGIHAEKVRGRFAMVVVRFKDLDDKRPPEVQMELLVNESNQWRLLPSSRPYIDGDEWNASRKDLDDIQYLEEWYFKKKKEILGYTHKPKRLQPKDEIFTRRRITDVDYVRQRLSAGLNPGIQNDTFTNHDSLIHFAVRHDAIATVAVLIEYGVDVNTASSGLSKTPLFYAAFNGNAKLIKLLIDHGADPNALDHFDNNALREAIAGGHALAVKTLLDAKVDAGQKNADGITMEQLAEEFGTDAIRQLFKHLKR